jgi:hypothetical protein
MTREILFSEEKKQRQRREELEIAVAAMKSRLHGQSLEISKLREQVQALTEGGRKRDDLIKNCLAENRILRAENDMLIFQKQDLLRKAGSLSVSAPSGVAELELAGLPGRQRAALEMETGGNFLAKYDGPRDADAISDLIDVSDKLRQLQNAALRVAQAQGRAEAEEAAETELAKLIDAERTTLWVVGDAHVWKLRSPGERYFLGGVVGAAKKAPIFLMNVKESALYLPEIDGADTLSMLCVPLDHFFVDRNPVVFAATRSKKFPSAFDERVEGVLMRAFTASTAARLAREGAHDRHLEEMKHFRVYRDALWKFLGCRKWREFAGAVEEVFMMTLHSPIARIFILDVGKGDTLFFFPGDAFPREEVPVHHGGLAGLVARTGERLFAPLGGGSHPIFSTEVDVSGNIPLLVLPVPRREGQSGVRLVVEVATPSAVTRNGNLASEVENIAEELVKIVAHAATAIDDFHVSSRKSQRSGAVEPGAEAPTSPSVSHGRHMRRLDTEFSFSPVSPKHEDETGVQTEISLQSSSSLDAFARLYGISYIAFRSQFPIEHASDHIRISCYRECRLTPSCGEAWWHVFAGSYGEHGNFDYASRGSKFRETESRPSSEHQGRHHILAQGFARQ